MLLIHWFLLTQIPVPELGTASLEMGKNLAGWIDYSLMPNHLWVHSKTWDPEGILGTIPATSSCLFGIYYGKIFLRESRFSIEQYYLGIFLGILLISLSFVWDIVFPINKGLWTGSYVLLTTGLAILVLHLLYDWIDVSKTKLWHKPFEIFGVNALAAFFLSSLFSKILTIPFLTNANGKQIGLKTYLYAEYFASYFSSYNASFVWALVYTILWLAFFSILYKRKIFIKL
jgi:predicted acyltransferase